MNKDTELPTPSEQNLADSMVTLTTDEQGEIVQLNSDYQEILIELGQLYLRKLQVDAENESIDKLETDHSNTYIEIQKKEKDFVTRLQRKYGEGKLDAPRGIYIKN